MNRESKKAIEQDEGHTSLRSAADSRSTFTTAISGGQIETVINASGDVIIPQHFGSAGTRLALHQLPPAPADFTGREAELDDLYRAIERGGITISGLRGMGGIGKTSLALALAHRLKPLYPDAQFFLDLKGDDRQNALSPSQAMSHVIRAFYSDVEVPTSESELKALYYSLLNGKRALLLMDNALDEAQVTPLLPPSSSVLLVTSRQHFNLPGISAKNINTLSPSDARKFLLKLAPRIAEHADDIAKRCGYLPLALRLAANALAKRVSLTPKDYLQQLSKGQERLALVDASVNISYKLLPADMRPLWRALSVFQEVFVVSMAADLWEVEADAAQNVLDEMVSYSLVEWYETTRFYRLHDLVRVFANGQLSETERMTAWQRRTARLTKETFQREQILQQFDAREREAVEYMKWIKAQIHDPYIERANQEGRRIHPAINNLESLGDLFTEFVGEWRKYKAVIKSQVGIPWGEVKKLQNSQNFESDVEALGVDLSPAELKERILKYDPILRKLQALESTLMLTENFFGLLMDLTLYIKTTGNLETFETRLESAIEVVLTTVALAKETIHEA